MPAVNPDMVLLTPIPDKAPGLIVQLPDGNPLKTTLPVAVVQSGWVIAPIAGADGVAGCVRITILADAAEVHPDAFVTEYENVPATNPEIVLLIPVPVMVPGLIVQLPAGSPFKTTLPVATPQLGWVIIPTVGEVGVTGCALITALAETKETHPTALVTL